MTKLNQESGRSMVEMLGVLAIIGVLSIGGIAGYTMAMNRYQANEVLNAASMAAILGMSANGGTGVAEETAYKSLTGAVLPSGATAIQVTVTDGKPSVSITAANGSIAEAMEKIAGDQIECKAASEGAAATSCTYTPNAN